MNGVVRLVTCELSLFNCYYTKKTWFLISQWGTDNIIHFHTQRSLLSIVNDKYEVFQQFGFQKIEFFRLVVLSQIKISLILCLLTVWRSWGGVVILTLNRSIVQCSRCGCWRWTTVRIFLLNTDNTSWLRKEILLQFEKFTFGKCRFLWFICWSLC